MMNQEVNNWDEQVKRRLEQFSPEPPPEIWEHIRSQMTGRKRERRLVLLAWTAVAAVVFIAMVTSILLTNHQPEIPASSVSINPVPPVPSVNPPAKDRLPDKRENTRPGMTPVLTAAVPDKVFFEAPAATKSEERRDVPSILALMSLNASAQTPAENLKEFLPEQRLILKGEAVQSDRLQPPDNVLMAIDTKKGVPAARNKPEWKIGIHLAPEYSSYSAGYSESYARQMSSAVDRSETGVGGGISVQYKNSRRLKIESGLYLARSGDKTSESNHFFASKADYAYLDINSNKFFSNAVNLNKGQISMNSTAGVIRLTQKPEDAKLIAGAESALGMSSTLLSSGEYFQVFDYVEIPLTARYRIIDRKIGVELLGGVSTNFVIGNQVFLGNDTERKYVGKTEDITSVGFAGMAGLGLVYPLGKHVSFSVEPKGSYWLSSLNNSGDVNFKPWRIGVYSGLTYTF